MKIYLVKNLNGTLKPAYNSDYELLSKIKPQEIYECQIKQPRNLKFHRKFFALIKMLFENQEQYYNMEHLRKALIIEAGFYDLRYDLHGVEIKEAKSISFSSMKQDEFDNLYNTVLNVIVKYFNFDRQEIIDNVEQYF